ncbi:hypothetical protein ACFLTE_05035 [Bacteroidota bacterium]
MKYPVIEYILFYLFVVLCCSCNDSEENDFNVEYLIDVKWGIPVIEAEGNINYTTFDAPTIFKENGTVEFGHKYIDYWQIYDSKSILIQNLQEVWIIYELSETIFRVNKIKHPKGDFIVECIYYPIE